MNDNELHNRLLRRPAHGQSAEPPSPPRAAQRFIPTTRLRAKKEVRKTNRPGIVLKAVNALCFFGRPESGGQRLKIKTVESISFIATDHLKYKTQTVA